MKRALVLVLLTLVLLPSCKGRKELQRDICDPCDCTELIKAARSKSAQHWTLAIPIAKQGQQFVGLKAYGFQKAPWAPMGFQKVKGRDEDNKPQVMVTGHVDGPTVFLIDIPTNVKKVDVEVGIPQAGGHKFTVTR